MACVENIPPANGDSEMEEGEIVDELDDLSDISSEEEFLLRQRLQVLENYNNVLERKKAKNSSVGSGKTEKCVDLLSQDLSEISATDNEDFFPPITVNKNNNNERNVKHKKRKGSAVVNLGKNRDTKKKLHRVKKKLAPKVVLESSDESDDEYRNKRRKLANAVVVNTPKNDTSTLRARLKKMFGTQSQPVIVPKQKSELEISACFPIVLSADVETIKELKELNAHKETEKASPIEISEDSQEKECELIDLCNDDEGMHVNEKTSKSIHDAVDGIVPNSDLTLSKPVSVCIGDSDDDLELLREHALKTKANKLKSNPIEEKSEADNKPVTLSQDEDSDTAELRLICLKSALLKKAIEMKQKQKMRKRLSQSIHDDIVIDLDKVTENNTDIESVDMEIGSDGDEKQKEISDHGDITEHVTEFSSDVNTSKDVPIPKSPKKDEIDEDEDLLRAKLLTSLSKNWPNLVDPAVIENLADNPSLEVPPSTVKNKTTLPVEKPFIIKLGESDSEGEHEATKNLTKMHLKLSEQMEFQQKLDLFLKSTRMEVEKQKLPDKIQKPPEQPKPAPKYVAKTVRHLPKSEQIEYKNLVKRMAELEKIKQARQTTMSLNKTSMPAKETLKPRNISRETPNNITINNLEEQIAMSRKKIAEESAKMLKLKDEAIKLSQKYKMVATELRNITTAITLNKKEQRSVQSRLTNIRQQHQTLIKSSTSNKHSKTNLSVTRHTNRNLSSIKLQKENDPSKEEYKNPQVLKSVKVSVVNDLKDESVANSRLSIQVDVSSNKKIVKIPKSPIKDRIVDFTKTVNEPENPTDATNPFVQREGEEISESRDSTCSRLTNSENHNHNKEASDYISPLDALHSENWAEDPNSFLCPFEVGGTCKDSDCKYLHPKIFTDQ